MKLAFALLLALATGAAAEVVNTYTSRDEYAAKNNVVLGGTLVPAGTPEFCKQGSATFMKDTGEAIAGLRPAPPLRVGWRWGRHRSAAAALPLTKLLIRHLAARQWRDHAMAQQASGPQAVEVQFACHAILLTCLVPARNCRPLRRRHPAHPRSAGRL